MPTSKITMYHSGVVHKGPVRLLTLERGETPFGAFDLLDGLDRNGRLVVRFDCHKPTQRIINRFGNSFQKGVYLRCHRSWRRALIEFTLDY